MKALYLLVLLVFVVGCAPKQPDTGSGSGKEVACESDADCACGVHKTTRECYIGHKNNVDTSVNADEVCPDFCSGISGKLQIKCVLGVCTQQ